VQLKVVELYERLGMVIDAREVGPVAHVGGGELGGWLDAGVEGLLIVDS
jgi:hypothetical protein